MAEDGIIDMKDVLRAMEIGEVYSFRKQNEEAEDIMSSSQAFDGIENLKMGSERFQKFVEHYNLQALASKSYFGSQELLYVSPNNAVVRIDCTDSEYRIASVKTIESNFLESMTQVDKLLCEKSDISIKGICETLADFCEVKNYFPNKGYCWELVMLKVEKYLQKTAIAEQIRKTMAILCKTQQLEAAKVRIKPELGKYYRRVNIEGDRSYEDSPMYVVNMGDSYVEMSYKNEARIIADIVNFYEYYTSVEDEYDDIINVLNEVFCYYLNDSLIDCIINGTKIYCDIRYFESHESYGAEYTLQRGVVNMYISDKTILGLYANIQYKQAKTQEYSVFGTMFDVPCILMNSDKSLLTPETIKKLYEKVHSLKRYLIDYGEKLLQTGMLPDEIWHAIKGHIITNIDKLLNNWDHICSLYSV